MFNLKMGALALALTVPAVPAIAASDVTDSISNPSSMWNGIDYWGVGVRAHSALDQTLSFDVAEDSKIDIYIGGSSKIQFTDLLINGVSAAGGFTLTGSKALIASGYVAAGPASIRFVGDYTCKDCWGDWFGGYVQVVKATIPAPAPLPDFSTGAVPEPASWAMMIGGLALVGGAMRRRKAAVRFA
jgi:hypothetical protein